MAKRKVNTTKKRPISKEKNVETSLDVLVKKLHSIMSKENIHEISWEEEDNFKIKLSRHGNLPVYSAKSNISFSQNMQIEKKEAIDQNEKADYIRSPMNGVFYRSASPNSEPFIKEDMEISIGTTVCIIEAMKLMNEVQVERHCRILKILVDHGSSVKVNQPLFEVDNL